eukprot:CAMPEP_0174356748 /NCGR_PEP_ID=MMETSP0811_2-20130205/31597_1 /TAXON_ID=73025 ORGANISM="Eutreptiella gymnastica-like, Strain CCMP1594" /NCGR_SAMPLE_ID=MMETSP0811_2 /ASSEMBLY_ACC=CAM_ASM_000667 /LENGTH=68 /DNA_ID=CAMNT_0015488973 /DNA_START=54 /DNA_END=258 /DNA_ORIENTATION=+
MTPVDMQSQQFLGAKGLLEDAALAPPIKHIPGYPHALRGGSCGQSKAWAHMGQRVREYDLWPSFFTKP